MAENMIYEDGEYKTKSTDKTEDVTLERNEEVSPAEQKESEPEKQQKKSGQPEPMKPEQKSQKTAGQSVDKADKKRISKSRADPAKEELPETRAERNTSYINKKEQEFKTARQNGLVRAGVTWNQVRHQINSGLYLGLTTEQVDLYANFFYSYEQMEIIKFALYDNTSKELLKELINPKLQIKEMLLIKSNTTIVKRLTDLFLRQDAYLNDTEKLHRELAEKTAEAAAVKSLTEELQAKLTASEARVRELSEKQHGRDKKDRKQETDSGRNAAPVQDRPATVETVADILAEPEHQTADPSAKPEKSGWKRFFHKPENPILSGKQLPAEFDLDDYVKKANLSPDQMQVLNFAVTNGFSDGDIKDLIEADLPADRMKALLEFKLIRAATAERRE